MTGQSGARKRPTQADVARLADVSQALVSYVINNSAAVSVPQETRQRVMDAVEALNYLPDRAAQSLRTSKTYTIASIIPDIANPFYPAFERGVQDVADDHGYDLITYNTDGIREKELKCLRSVQQRRADGLIATFFFATLPDLRPLLERDIAIVRMEARAQKGGELPLDNLYVDNAAAAHAAVAYLIGRGHTRIATIAARLGPGYQRLIGYRQALVEADVTVDEALAPDGGFTERGGYAAMSALLALPVRPTAVFAANDLMAMGALLALREAHLRVPQDMAVMGFDDIPAARLVYPPLTTVSLFQEDLGRRSAQMLLERLTGGAPPGGRCEVAPFKLIIRAST